MSSTDLIVVLPVDSTVRAAVVLGHEDLQFLSVSVFGRFPSRLVGFVVEVVWEILGVGVSNLPVWRKTCVGLLRGRLAGQ